MSINIAGTTNDFQEITVYGGTGGERKPIDDDSDDSGNDDKDDNSTSTTTTTTLVDGPCPAETAINRAARVAVGQSCGGSFFCFV